MGKFQVERYPTAGGIHQKIFREFGIKIDRRSPTPSWLHRRRRTFFTVFKTPTFASTTLQERFAVMRPNTRDVCVSGSRLDGLSI
jgi:hypothetical protein